MKIVEYNKNLEYGMRKEKLSFFKKEKCIFQNFEKNSSAKEIKKIFQEKKKIETEKNKKIFCISGRILSKRDIGKVIFLTILDEKEEIQVYCKKDFIKNFRYEILKKYIDIGDIIGIKGKVFKTRTGELSIYCKKIQILAKSLHPIPKNFYGIADKEIKYRKRYLDLILNRKSKEVFYTRSKIIQKIRDFMHFKNFIEVETPMMQKIPGGASAKPFITYHNSLNLKLYLRIAPELYLKRLIVGGFEKIFEISKNFRNEGISSRHNPEFTMMELYVAYASYKYLMKFTEKFFHFILNSIFRKKKILYKEKEIDFQKPFEKISLQNIILKKIPSITKENLKNFKELKKIAISLNIAVENHWNLGTLQLKIFEKKIEKNIIQPTFITDYPSDISPLSKKNKKNLNFSERFELFVHGMEIANGFSELNDPEEQSKNFLQQLQEKKYKNEKEFYDKEYIESLEYGMPPTAGMGIGIDRLVMLLTNSESIKDVILFPILKTKNS
ncbi:lysine--tRNA ligase [bacterium endosymbiont of Pedicinus badii]|uniref:lysine--tRNA ligase n=1 Tax=bacterium endosymbiont of Pedicinus badii TaxID=1719126 RepID=UPI0009BA34B6|nr:lysine--tRNA ligase [bacterium endosymbiont of Pedicinus badii]OQM34009.1 lysine--tRNA ligase [bacterium endosymbiont of Pedicinus badii]